jgi:molecular chaperone HtpG
VDAVRLWDKRYSGSGPREHRIDIAVDASKRSVTVSDTGTGISPDQLPFLLAPHSTDKDSDADLIGEKGVGITYTVFSSNVYRIKTAAIDGSADALIRNAASWKNRTSEEAPAVALTRDTAPVEPRSTGTTVEAADVEKFDPLDEDLFSQSANVIAYIIRTRTAIGNTGAVFGNPRPAIHVSFTYTDAVSLCATNGLSQESRRHRLLGVPGEVSVLDGPRKTREAQGQDGDDLGF